MGDEMRKIFLLLTIAVMAITLTGCNNTPREDTNVVYITVYPMQFLVEEIAGDTIEVNIVPGTSHSSGNPWTAQEIISMSDSDLLFYVNGGADSYVESNASLFEGENVMLVDMSQHIEYNEICLSHDDHDDDDEEHEETVVCDENSLTPDPHFWLDPVKMLIAAEFVKDKLIATFPDNQELYNNNYTVLEATLTQLDLDFQLMADEATSPILTTVRLFTYFHERYGIEMESMTNDIHESEEQAGAIIEFLDYAAANDISYIMFEKHINSPLGEKVLTALQGTNSEASKLELHGLGFITVDEEENGSTYITIMYDNLEALNLSTK